MKNQDWKLKYKDLKLKFHDAVDVSFRLGFEAGAQQAQVQQAQQQQAAAEQAQQAAMMGQDPNAPGQEGQMPGEEANGSELDQHINTLEGMLGSGSPDPASFQKSLNGIKSFMTDLKTKYELKKSEKAIAAIGKALKSPFTLSKTATKNLSEPAKKALNMQEQIVSDLMKSFDEEEKKAAEAVTKTLNFEQILRG